MGTLHVHEDAYAIGDLVKRVGLQRKIHPACGTELVDQNLMPGMTFNMLEQDCGTARGQPFKLRMMRVRPTGLGDSISDLGDFQYRIDFSPHPAQLPGALQCLDPLAKIAIRQTVPLGPFRPLSLSCGSNPEL